MWVLEPIRGQMTIINDDRHCLPFKMHAKPSTAPPAAKSKHFDRNRRVHLRAAKPGGQILSPADHLLCRAASTKSRPATGAHSEIPPKNMCFGLYVCRPLTPRRTKKRHSAGLDGGIFVKGASTATA